MQKIGSTRVLGRLGCLLLAVFAAAAHSYPTKPIKLIVPFPPGGGTAVNADAVAEHDLALLLAAAKSVIEMNARMHAGHWDKATHKSLELRGKTVGLVGLGAIGLRFAMLCKALGMRVVGHDPFVQTSPMQADRCAAAGVEVMDLATLLSLSDVLSLHCPLTSENKSFINHATLSKCKRGVIFINTARGGLVDEVALLAAVIWPDCAPTTSPTAA